MSVPAIFVVTVERAHRRWAWLSRGLERRGVEFERVESVDGQRMTAEEAERHRAGGGWYTMTPTGLGRALGMYEAWKRIADAESCSGVVLEDDAVPLPGMVEALQLLGAEAEMEGGLEPRLVKLHSAGPHRGPLHARLKATERRLTKGRCLGTGEWRVRRPLLARPESVATWMTRAAARRLVAHLAERRFARETGAELAQPWRTEVDIEVLEPEVFAHAGDEASAAVQASMLQGERSVAMAAALGTARGRMRRMAERGGVVMRCLEYAARARKERA